jgi:hypothetical protein
MLAGSTATMLGLQGVYLGCLARVFYDFTGASRRRLLKMFPYTRTALVAFGVFVLGVGLTVPLIALYIRGGWALPEGVAIQMYEAVAGMMLVVLGFSTFVFTLLLHAAAKLADRTYGRA